MKQAKWVEVRLGDHVDLLAGFAFKSKQFTSNPNDVALVKGSNVHQGFIDWDDSVRWPADEYDLLAKFQLVPGDVILAMDRPWIEAGLKWSWIRCNDPRSLLVQRVSRMRGIKGLDTDFLRYIIASSQFTDYIRPIVTGVNVPHISGDQIKGFRFHLPTVVVQRKIAAILSAYDDLIDNNTRRIAILEEMAQVIYREWFVEFRFPGHEKLKMVASPLGKIPDGWRVVPLKDITTKIGSGATPKGGKESYKDTGITLIRSLNVYDYRFDMDGLAFIDEDQAKQLANVTVQKMDVLLNITGASVARCCMVPSHLLPARVNQHVALIRVDPSLARPFYVLMCLNSPPYKDLLLSLAQGGATREALTKEKIGDFRIVLPSQRILCQFDEIAASVFQDRELLERKNTNLRTTRDLLLPKLISGEIDVENMDIAVDESNGDAEPQATKQKPRK